MMCCMDMEYLVLQVELVERRLLARDAGVLEPDLGEELLDLRGDLMETKWGGRG